MDAVLMLHNIDSAFINHLEMKNDGVKFLRIDADLSDNFKEEVGEDELKETESTLSDLFKKVLNNDKLNVKVEKLKNADTSSIITLSEEARRMQDMMEMYGMMGGMDPSMFGMAADSMTLVLNANNSLVQYVLANPEGEHTAIFCEQLFDLALLANKPLAPEQMSRFIARSNRIMNLLTK